MLKLQLAKLYVYFGNMRKGNAAFGAIPIEKKALNNPFVLLILFMLSSFRFDCVATALGRVLALL